MLRWAAKMSFFRGLWKSSSKHKSKLSLFFLHLFFEWYFFFHFFFFFGVSRIKRRIFISIVCIEVCENECKYDWKLFFFFEGWLFEREKNIARFWNISDVSDDGIF